MIYMCTIRISLVFLVLFTMLVPVPSSAQNAQIMSVAPPLYQVAAQRGEIWRSTLKVVNGNPYPLTVYIQVVNFKPVGESGRGRFVPVLQGDTTMATLAEWITIGPGPYTIENEQSIDIPFFLDVPDDAAPGGHYAAILVSTEPPKEKNGMAVQTSQAISSLFFLRIEGDTIEEGRIRDFSVTDAFVDRPSVEFSLRFENKGNVHLQPRGNIVITNMWGTERGVIPINYQTHFGNVLPESIRDFIFTWESSYSITDIGRYKATVNLTYGAEEKQSASATTYFWVIPIKATLITLGILVICIGLVILMIRAYIRRMLILAGVDPERKEKVMVSESPQSSQSTLHKKNTYTRVTAPLRDGVLDLRARLNHTDEPMSVPKTVFAFILTYKKFFFSVLVLITMFIGFVLYVQHATDEDVDYTVTIDEGGVETRLDDDAAESQVSR